MPIHLNWFPEKHFCSEVKRWSLTMRSTEGEINKLKQQRRGPRMRCKHCWATAFSFWPSTGFLELSLLEEGAAQQTHLTGINSVVILVGVPTAALGFMRYSFLAVVHAVLTSNPKGSQTQWWEGGQGRQRHQQRSVDLQRHRAKTRPSPHTQEVGYPHTSPSAILKVNHNRQQLTIGLNREMGKRKINLE